MESTSCWEEFASAWRRAIAALSFGKRDLLNVNGTVNVSAATLELLLLNAPPAQLFAGGTYLLLANDGADPVSGTFASILGLPPDYVASVDYAFSGTDSLGRIGNGNDIAVTLVPEPGMLSLLGLGAVAMLRRRKPVTC